MIKKIIRFFLFLFLIISIIIIYSRYEATSNLITNEITIKDNINESYNGLKIVHFSDLHYGRIISDEQIDKVIKEINSLKPDIVVFTGDLIDDNKNIKNDEFLTNSLSKITAKYGKYAILGDDDYSNEEQVIRILNNSDFQLLNNFYDVIFNENNEKIFIGGIGSSLKNDDDLSITMNYFENNDANMYKILLIHEPDYIDTIIQSHDNVNLVLAGHSHLGQIRLPLLGAVVTKRGYEKYPDSHYKIENTNLYVSSGIGVSHYNFRLFNNPSINLYRINNTNEKE